MLFTCIKSWFFRNHLASFHQISHWSFCWNVIDSLFKWSCSIDCQAHIFFFKTTNCSNDDIFISCDDRIGKMLHNICMSAVAVTQVSESWPVGLLFFLLLLLKKNDYCIWTSIPGHSEGSSYASCSHPHGLSPLKNSRFPITSPSQKMTTNVRFCLSHGPSNDKNAQSILR